MPRWITSELRKTPSTARFWPSVSEMMPPHMLQPTGPGWSSVNPGERFLDGQLEHRVRAEAHQRRDGELDLDLPVEREALLFQESFGRLPGHVGARSADLQPGMLSRKNLDRRVLQAVHQETGPARQHAGAVDQGGRGGDFKDRGHW